MIVNGSEIESESAFDPSAGVGVSEDGILGTVEEIMNIDEDVQ